MKPVDCPPAGRDVSHRNRPERTETIQEDQEAEDRCRANHLVLVRSRDRGRGQRETDHSMDPRCRLVWVSRISRPVFQRSSLLGQEGFDSHRGR